LKIGKNKPFFPQFIIVVRWVGFNGMVNANDDPCTPLDWCLSWMTVVMIYSVDVRACKNHTPVVEMVVYHVHGNVMVVVVVVTLNVFHLKIIYVNFHHF
jgi:hypothetical protein